MNPILYQNVAKSSAHRASRDFNAKYIFDQPELFCDLVEIAFDINDPNHHKACWVLELVLEAKIEWLQRYLDDFCKTLPGYSHEGAVRSISKISLFAATEHLKKTGSGGFLNENQQQQITETCFDWLIGDAKVASKAYAARALFLLGKLSDWIYPELKIILEKDYASHSPAYKAVAREILKKI